jgi:pimeloyl-ACP methyl ester carboxylesterase
MAIDGTMDSRSQLPRRPFKRQSIYTILLLANLVLTIGCSMVNPNRRIEASADYNFISGYVYCDAPRSGPVVVVAYEKKANAINIADYTVLDESGPYELMVSKGRYQVLAFGDENRDLVFEKDEPFGKYGDKMPSWIDAGEIEVTPEIAISAENKSTPDCPFGLSVSEDKPENLRTRPTGEIADLKDHIFDEGFGAQGYWSPRNFLREIGANIFLLEDYDPDKIPVLFIHGATGTPRGWRCFIESMNRSRFQPWFYYYPSGAPVKSMSNLLFLKLLKLRKKHHFDSMFIIAHSLGGLVARSFIMDFETRFPFVRLFLAIATPWGGDKMAGYGVRHSPVVVPCWRDLQPDGSFLYSLYHRRMPEGIDFYIFFGHKGNRNPFRPNNDGTISLASLLDPRSQSDAKRIIGFNEDHESILYSKAVLGKYNAILNEKQIRPHRKHSILMSIGRCDSRHF